MKTKVKAEKRVQAIVRDNDRPQKMKVVAGYDFWIGKMEDYPADEQKELQRMLEETKMDRLAGCIEQLIVHGKIFMPKVGTRYVVEIKEVID